MSFTPTAGDTLEVRIAFQDSEYDTLYTWEKSYNLTGTPTYDLQMADGTVNITLNNETNELEAHYELSGGNGNFRRLEYEWEYFLPGGGYTDFYQEGRAAIDGSSGTLKLATAMNGTYKLFLNIYDESEDRIYHQCNRRQRRSPGADPSRHAGSERGRAGAYLDGERRIYAILPLHGRTADPGSGRAGTV